MKLIMLLFTVSVLGCSGPTFRNIGIGRGVGVSTEVVEGYARERGISKAEAASELRQQFDQKRISTHARKYGLTLEQARSQLEFAGELPAADGVTGE